MTTTAKLYYLAAILAVIALTINLVDEGFTSDEYFHVGFLAVMAIALFLLGRRGQPASGRRDV